MTDPDVAALLSKSKEWHETRLSGIGGSDATIIATGEWQDLWLVKTGRKQPESLDDVLPVQIGTWTEPLNRYWFSRQTGKTIDIIDEPRIHAVHPFIRANLDGMIGDAIFEAKHVNAFTDMDACQEKYYPQLQHCMAVTGAPMAYLSVFFGNHKWDYAEIPFDADYADELISAEFSFWVLVETDTPPDESNLAVIAPPSLNEMREVDMTGNNAWSYAANDWIAHRGAANAFRKAEKILKELMEPDMRRAYGHGVEINRSKNGALRIKDQK